jgi:hypothetical protein
MSFFPRVFPRSGIGGGGAAPVRLDLFTGGTFTRSSEGSYLTGPATDGTSAFLAWATTNARRIEYDPALPGGTGLLMEGSRQNLALHSEDFTQAAWTKSLVTVTSNAGNAPDGDADADDLVYDADAAAEVTQTFTAADNTRGNVSVYLRCTAGTESVILRVLRKDGTYVTKTCAVTTTWARFDLPITSMLTGGSTPTMSILNGDASARTVRAWGAQIEMGSGAGAPSSYIRTGAAAATRALDAHSYNVGEYPAEILTTGWRWKVVPQFTNATPEGNSVPQFLGITGGWWIRTVGATVAMGPGAGLTVNTIIGGWARSAVLDVLVEWEQPSAGNVRLTVTGGTSSPVTASGTYPGYTPAALRPLITSDTQSLRLGRYIEVP